MAGFFGKFFGSTISEAAGYGIGSAIEKPIEPVLQEITNESWRAAVAAGVEVPLDPSDAAEIVAEDVELQSWGADQAAQTGVGADQFDALVRATLNAPGLGELLRILRRHPEALSSFEHGLRKNRYETLWDTYLQDLGNEKLQPAVIALAIVRGIMTDPGFLPVGPPTTEGKIAAFPTSPLDALLEAAAAGIDKERLFVETAVAGRPPGPVEAAQATFRGIIEDVDFKRAIAEGDVRNEWADALFEVSRQILTSGEYAELELRGYIDRTARLSLTAQHGMSTADSDLLYNVLGRAPSTHTVVVGLARGGVYPGSYANVPSPYKEAIQRSNIREEWSEVVYAARYNYPSAFVVKSLATGGDLTQAQTVEILLEIGWDPKWANLVAAKWVPTTTATVDTHVKSATTSAITAIRKAYIGLAITHAEAVTALTSLQVDPATQTQLFQVWDVQKNVEHLPPPTA